MKFFCTICSVPGFDLLASIELCAVFQFFIHVFEATVKRISFSQFWNMKEKVETRVYETNTNTYRYVGGPLPLILGIAIKAEEKKGWFNSIFSTLKCSIVQK